MPLSLAEGLAYGILQGLTEVLPISSSAHLVLLPWFLGWDDPGLGFDVALHGGTLLAVLWYFWRDWWVILTGTAAALRQGALAASAEANLLAKLAVASVPGGIAGLSLAEAAESSFRAPLLVAAMLAGFGVLLYLSDRRTDSRKGLEHVGWREALWIGMAQAVAIVPGVSRSGVTITMARAFGIDRETSARFSFLLATPIIAGATAVKMGSFAAALTDPGQLVALVASTVFGFVAIAGLIRFVRGRSYAPFALYRLILAAVILATALR